MPSISAGTARSLPTVIAVTLQDECRKVAEALAGEESRPREDLLAMYGRSSAASGRFDLAAAAYAMFLDESGIGHPYTERIAMRLADCLAPLNLDTIDVFQTAGGPEYRPTWRMGYSPTPERLRQAIAAYRLVADIANDPRVRGRALFRSGWVHRALKDWQASTAAWDQCAKEASGTGFAADALWLASENLEWNNHAAAAAQRMRRFVSEYPPERRAALAVKRAEVLEAESRRGAEWLDDPLGALQDEIAQRRDALPPHEIYQSVVRWLERGGRWPARITLGRWAIAQQDWPARERLLCHYTLVDALLGQPDVSEGAKLEAAAVLGRVAELAPSDEWLVPACVRRASLLREVGRASDAAAALAVLEDRIDAPAPWTDVIMPEQIRVLAAMGDYDGARTVLDEFIASHPEHDAIDELRAEIEACSTEGKP